ncbi:hypothetical protein FQR65_LT17101 [Abscondita terminalis]|nr:hypothetical protein FQR65_LT17101 [Abscondita terminalis]
MAWGQTVTSRRCSPVGPSLSSWGPKPPRRFRFAGEEDPRRVDPRHLRNGALGGHRCAGGVTLVIIVEDLAIDVGARRLMGGVSFRVNPGDKIGLVGRNGAGKTTLTRTLSGELQPAEGSVTVSGELGFLPQDPRTGDPEQIARHRILDARGLGTLTKNIARATEEMGSDNPATAENLILL